MATDPILLRAILAMDAYNRGYAPGIKDLGGEGSTIGEATLGKDATQLLSAGTAAAAGFYAAAYTLSDGSKVISYRGTDQLTANPYSEFGSDVWNGYSLAGGGTPNANQAAMAIAFYNAVLTQSSYQGGPEIALTGHSLGGGLA